MDKVFILVAVAIFFMGASFFFELNDYIKLTIFVVFMMVMLFAIVKTKGDR